MNKTYIVCWVNSLLLGDESHDSDHYEVFMDGTPEENLEKANKKYDELLLEETTYSANVCEVVKSTDY